MQNKGVSIWTKVMLSLVYFLTLVGCQTSGQESHSLIITEISTSQFKSTSTQTLTPSLTPNPINSPIPTQTVLPPTNTPFPTSTPNRLPQGVEAVIISTEDGLDLAGFLHTPHNSVANSIAMVLAHEFYSTHHSWEWLAEKLANEGFTTLTFDARGHGKSPGGKFVNTAGIDAKAAVNYLTLQGFNQIICLGTSMGGSGCLVAAVEMELSGLAMISSPMNIGGPRLITRLDLENLKIPKIFMIAEDDRVGADFVAEFIEMTEMAAAPKDVYLYPGDHHASELFFAEFGDEIKEELIKFVKGFSQTPEEQPVVVADCVAAGLPEIACTGVAKNDEWTPFTRDANGVEMVLVPAGCFQMGNDDGFPEEQPVHEICFDQPYWVDLTEVTVAQFARFMNDQPDPVNSHEKWIDPGFAIYLADVQLIMEGSKWMALPGRANKPLESVRWVGARDYCTWRGARLPTEAEWEYAARGPDNWLFPWGNEFIAANVVRHHGQTPDVGSKPQGASWVGAMDMSSSLFEWTSSIYLPYPYNPDDGREASLGNNSVSDRVFRGSAWYHPEGMHDNVSATARFDAPPDYAAWYYGFRCARSID